MQIGLSAFSPARAATFPYTPALELIFAGNTALDSRITFARADATTCATRYNSSGVLETVAANVPRFDYDPVTLAPKGLLIEESRTNLLLRSEDFTTTWATVRATAPASNVAVAPDGASTADRFIEDSTAGNNHYIYQSVAKAASNIQYTYSVFLKAGTRTWAMLGLGISTGVVTKAVAYINLTTGALGTVGGSGFTGISATTPVNCGNGWWRCSITATSDLDLTVACGLASATADGTISYNGDGTSGFYMWGASLEAGAFPTSYIPTTTGPIQRQADSASMTGTNFSSWYSQSAGTFVVESDSVNYAGATAYVFAANNGNVTDMLYIRRDGGLGRFVSLVANVAQANLSATGTPSIATVKQAFAYASADFAATGNGGTPVTAVSGTLPTVNQLQIGNRQDMSTSINGHIRRLSFYPTRLPNATLQALTA